MKKQHSQNNGKSALPSHGQSPYGPAGKGVQPSPIGSSRELPSESYDANHDIIEE